MSKPRKIAIVGSGGHALAIWDACRSAGFQTVCFIDPHKHGSSIANLPVMGSVAEVPLEETELALGIGANFTREDLYYQVVSQFPGARFPPVVHSAAWVSESATLGAGSAILAMASVGANSSVGCGALLNTGSSLDHDSVAGDFSSLAPGARTGGDCAIGARSAIGMGASIVHSVTVGADSVVGAQSLVRHSVEGSTVVYGIPAKKSRQRSRSDPYL